MKPRINPWTCYGGGLIAGVVAFSLFDGDFMATIGGTVAWFVVYTFNLAMRSGGQPSEEEDNAQKPVEEEGRSRQSRRAAARRAGKSTNRPGGG